LFSEAGAETYSTVDIMLHRMCCRRQSEIAECLLFDWLLQTPSCHEGGRMRRSHGSGTFFTPLPYRTLNYPTPSLRQQIPTTADDSSSSSSSSRCTFSVDDSHPPPVPLTEKVLNVKLSCEHKRASMNISRFNPNRGSKHERKDKKGSESTE
jgi:hypothetical protein